MGVQAAYKCPLTDLTSPWDWFGWARKVSSMTGEGARGALGGRLSIKRPPNDMGIQPLVRRYGYVRLSHKETKGPREKFGLTCREMKVMAKL